MQYEFSQVIIAEEGEEFWNEVLDAKNRKDVPSVTVGELREVINQYDR